MYPWIVFYTIFKTHPYEQLIHEFFNPHIFKVVANLPFAAYTQQATFYTEKDSTILLAI